MTPDSKAVLLIGDDPTELASIGGSLSKAADTYVVVQAPDVDAALEVLERQAVHLALMDVSSADGVRLDSLARIRSRAPSLPVLVVSDTDDETIAIEAVRLGAQDFLVKTDISDVVIARVVRHALERERTVSRLRALDALKSKFVSTVSHEIRTPLAIVREFVSLVHDDVVGPTTDEQRECLQSALRNCDRLTGLINDLLDLSRIESEGLTLRRVRTELDPLLRRCVEDFRPKVDAQQQRLTLDIPEATAPVLCDPDRVQQVVVNLLGNAHKFTAPGGTIVVRVRSDGEFARVEVEDTGSGIGPRDRQRIFDAFSQVSRKDASDSQGTGLGLTISKSIIDQHGGEMVVDSEPGRGSCFAFTLPRYEDGAEFDVFVADRLRNHDPQRKAVTIVVVRCRKDGDAGLAALRRFQKCADLTLRSRRDEMLLVESKRVLVCLLESDREGSLIALERIAEALRGAPEETGGLEFGLIEPAPEPHRNRPLAPDEADFRPLASVLDRGVAGRVLVVDDDAMVLRLIELVLQERWAGLDIRTSSTGFEACIEYGRFRPDLVILDLQIPDVDGEEVLASMMADRGVTSKFLVVSAHEERFARMRALGCDDCLAKPLFEPELLGKVRGLLPEAALRDE